MSIVTEIEALKANLTNAYTSISAKGGTIPANKNAQNLSSAIDSITTGGSTPVVEAEKKDINFYDYDGTRLYSWTLAELATKTELPALPTQQGLTCQGWNWSLAELKEQNTQMNVGAMYITDDGKTRIYIHLEEARKSPYLKFNTEGQNPSVEIDWGDGSSIQTVTSASTPILHEYASGGNYMITLNPLNDTEITLVGDTYGRCLISGNISRLKSQNRYYANCLKKVELGKGVKAISNYAFYYSPIETISMPIGVNLEGTDAFAYSTIKYFTIDGEATWKNSFNNSSLVCISFPSRNTNWSDSAFGYAKNLEELYTPKSVPSSSTTRHCISCEGLKKVIWGLNSINANDFASNYSLTSFYCANDVISIGADAFYGCYTLKYVTFLFNTIVPTLSASDTFSYAPSDCQIVVPDSLYDEWVQATNWAALSSQIIKASEWEG